MLPFTSLQLHTTPLIFNTTHKVSHSCGFKPQYLRIPFVAKAAVSNNPFELNQQQGQQQPRTLFRGGYKRAEIKVPKFVLRLEAAEVLAKSGDNNNNNNNRDVLDLVDKAVAKCVGIVVVDGGEESGKKLYEASCLLKSVIRDRAYLLVTERVDIASAVHANGVLLSDQGLPTIVARDMMIGSKTESVVLPLVARRVRTVEAALSASNSEGADFLIYETAEEGNVDDAGLKSVFSNVKIPIFMSSISRGENMSVKQASKLLAAGASGLIISLADLLLFGDDVLSELLNGGYMRTGQMTEEVESLNILKMADSNNGYPGKKDDLTELRDREKQFMEKEKSVLLKAINVINKAAPLMEEVSLLADAVSQLSEPFLLAIVGEFNSGKSTFINALLGRRYLNEGVVPTTNEITFIRFSDMGSGEQKNCERHPDGQYVCYLPAPILKEMNIVDTPGTNVILQRQQRLTEEFVPRADLLLFVLSADRPLTESEVAFLRYIQQWKKKIVFILNKSDIYRNAHELNAAISFITENAKKLLNSENITLYPVSARSALEAKLASSFEMEESLGTILDDDSSCRINTFNEFEGFLLSFLDASTSRGMERIKLKLETPISIAERLLSSCETIVRQDCRYAQQNLANINNLVSSVEDYAIKMDRESISWRRQTLSLIDRTKSQVLLLLESVLQLSNFNAAASYLLRGEKSSVMSTTSKFQTDIISPAHLDAQKILGDYVKWLQSNSIQERRLYKETFTERWHALLYPDFQVHLETHDKIKKAKDLSLSVIENFNTATASKVFEQEIREVFLGTFGGLGAAGISASLLTSVLPTTVEDLLALGLCSAGGLLAISVFPARRQEMVNKVRKTADALASELEQAMQKDLLHSVSDLENFVKIIGKPYQDAAQRRLDKLLEIQEELSNVRKELRKLQIEIQNFHAL